MTPYYLDVSAGDAQNKIASRFAQKTSRNAAICEALAALDDASAEGQIGLFHGGGPNGGGELIGYAIRYHGRVAFFENAGED